MADFRALCSELIDALDSGIPAGRIRMSPLADRARAALSEPEPESPTDEPMIPDHCRGDGIRVYREGFHAGYKYAFRLIEK